jgi:hypothetical protein
VFRGRAPVKIFRYFFRLNAKYAPQVSHGRYAVVTHVSNEITFIKVAYVSNIYYHTVISNATLSGTRELQNGALFNRRL